MKIGVLTGADEKQLNLLNITLPILQQYCLKHNYDIHFFTSNVDGVHQEEGKSFFARYPFIKKHLPNYDWIFWIDADCLVMNFYKKFEDYIDNKYSLILDQQLGSPLPNCASGHGFWKNDETTARIVDQIIELAPKMAYPGFADNEVLNHLINDMYTNNKKEFKRRIKIKGPGKDRIGHYDKEIVECHMHTNLGQPEGGFDLYDKSLHVTFDDIYTPGRDFLYHRSGVDVLQRRTEAFNDIVPFRDFATKESDLKYHADRIVREKLLVGEDREKIDPNTWFYTILDNRYNGDGSDSVKTLRQELGIPNFLE
jgi:hypothetical protein